MKLLTLFKCMIFVTVISALLSCRRNPAIYEMPNDPRSYVWKADTLSFYQHNIYWGATLNRLWGSSGKDVYAVGMCPSAGGRMYHFDGVEWKYSKEVRVIGENGAYDLANIFGFSKNDVWAVGSRNYSFWSPGENPDDRKKNLIIHYDGVSWNEVYSSDWDTTMYRELISIWGSSPDDIWFGGCWADMYHYDDETVTQDTMPFDIKNYIG